MVFLRALLRGLGLVGILLALGGPVPCYGQGQRPPKHVIAPDGGIGAQDARAADLDGDGDLDLLVASTDANQVGWSENRGDGTFKSHRTISRKAESVRSVDAGDLDGDGDPDVVAAGGEGYVRWYENRLGTAGDFGGGTPITTSLFRPESVRIADLNGDGAKDVVYGSAVDDLVAWRENLESGGFSDRKVLTKNAASVREIGVADLNGDGNPDVLSAAASSSTVAWYENQGGGQFADPAPVANVEDGAISLATADVEGDGDLDVFTATDGTTTRKIAWHRNDGTGTFDSTRVVTSKFAGFVSTSDFGGDGDPDVLFVGNRSNKVLWAENRGAKGDEFAAPDTVDTDQAKEAIARAAALSGDGDKDILATSPEANEVSFYENRLAGGKGFGRENAAVPKRPLSSVLAADVTDLNGDGAPDVLIGASLREEGKQKGRIGWHENQSGSPGTFSLLKVFDRTDGFFDSPLGGVPSDVRPADIDQDGDPDVVATWANRVVWYKNRLDEGGGFSKPETIGEKPNLAPIRTSDLDGDEDPDVIVGGSNPPVWFENQVSSTGAFSTERTLPLREEAKFLSTADLNGDGDQDIARVLGGTEARIGWFENRLQKDGTFSTVRTISKRNGEIRDFRVADLTGDGAPELLFSDWSGNEIVWYKNRWAERFEFEGPKTLASVQDPNPVHTADLDGDDDLDVLGRSVTARGTYNAGWMENQLDEGGAFSGFRVIGGSDDAFQLFIDAADLSQDGATDVLTVSSNREILWYESTSTTLPVELAGLQARVGREGSVHLRWKTGSETGNAGFAVQRRLKEGRAAPPPEPSDWTTVGFVESKVEGGTTSRSTRYRFTDASAPYRADRLTYRLKQVDVDGSVHYSRAVTVRRTVSEVQLRDPYPNPASRRATVQYALPREGAPQEISLTLYDALGRRVRTLVEAPRRGRHETTVDLSGLPSGTYFLRLRAGSEAHTRRLTIVQ